VSIKGDTLEMDGKPEEIMKLLRLFMKEGIVPQNIQPKDRKKFSQMVS